MKTLVIIPSRLSATRLPGKPLLKINGLSIISHVFKRAEKANIGEVIVATEDQAIIDDVKKNGGQAILTHNKHKTGTDRIYEALNKLERPDIELVLNVQGDEPLIDIDDIRNLHNQMLKSKVDIGTLASNIKDKKLYEDLNTVKVITNEKLNNSNFPKALSFLRKIHNQNENTYHHHGIYCYKLAILKKLVNFNQSSNEISNNLEQLRALDNNIQINVSLANTASVGIDTEQDLVAIKKIMEYKT